MTIPAMSHGRDTRTRSRLTAAANAIDAAATTCQMEPPTDIGRPSSGKGQTAENGGRLKCGVESVRPCASSGTR